jgi:C1A family cysteine protease
MFKTLFLFASVLRVFASENVIRGDTMTTFLDESDEWKQFSNFQDRFSRKYENIQEFDNRFQIFRNNLRNIIIHNLDHSQNFTMGINQFTDLTPQEFKAQYIGGYKPLQSFGCGSFSTHDNNAPVSIDWTTKGVVNPVRDQGQCGSCWAFATTANAESVWAISKGQLLDLSEEFLVDCASGVGYFNLGCNGGQPDSALKYMINNGQCTEASYPYTSGVTKTAGSCQKCPSAGVSFTNCFDVTPKDQVALKSAVSKQPVVIAIEADTKYFQSYSSGILTDGVKCGTNLDHAVEIVGFGTENGIDYWKVRNSWSESWGENGYIRIQKTSSTNDIGVCGIAAEPSFISV